MRIPATGTAPAPTGTAPAPTGPATAPTGTALAPTGTQNVVLPTTSVPSTDTVAGTDGANCAPAGWSIGLVVLSMLAGSALVLSRAKAVRRR